MCIRLTGCLAASLLLWAGAAVAQQAEITVVLDHSASMGESDDPAGGNACEDANANRPDRNLDAAAYLKSRFMTVQDVLVGKVPAQGRWCRVDDRGARHEMCCANIENGACGQWRPCKTVGRDESGFIRRHRNDVDFRIMRMDADPADRGNQEGGERNDNDVRQVGGARVNLGAQRAAGQGAINSVKEIDPEAEGAPITGMCPPSHSARL